jgi:hypothetical protein
LLVRIVALFVAATFAFCADHLRIIIQPGPECVVGPPPTMLVSAAGASGVVDVGQSASCLEIGAGSDVPWASVRFLVKAAPNTVEWTVQPNPGPMARTANISFGGQLGEAVWTINQEGSCAATITRTSASVPYTGGVTTLTAAPVSATCAWVAGSSARWTQVYPLTSSISTPVTVTTFPNFSSQQRNATVTIGDQSLNIMQPGNPRTFNERLVQLFYFGAFGRLPVEAEVMFQVAAVQAGFSRAQLLANFFGSEEFQLGGRFVAGAYLGLLNRLPEYNGWLFQRNAMATRFINEQDLVQNVLGSAEYKLLFGDPTPAEFVRLLYRHILFRDASDAEVAFQVSHLGAGLARNRMLLARSLLLSPEFLQNTSIRFNAYLVHATLLGREPTPAEFSDASILLPLGLTRHIEAIMLRSEFGPILQ